MVGPLKLLRHLSQHGARLWVEGDDLCCSAPAGVISNVQSAWIGRHKQEVISFLRQLDRPDIDAQRPETWPESTIDWCNGMAHVYCHWLDQQGDPLAKDYDAARKVIEKRVALGTIQIPTIAVYQRLDGTFPEVGLNAEVEHVFTVGVAS